MSGRGLHAREREGGAAVRASVCPGAELQHGGQGAGAVGEEHHVLARERAATVGHQICQVVPHRGGVGVSDLLGHLAAQRNFLFVHWGRHLLEGGLEGLVFVRRLHRTGGPVGSFSSLYLA